MPRRCRGFTLLELMIVLVLIGVLMGMVSFATGSSPARQARQEAHAFAGLIRQLREQAVLDGQEHGVRLSDAGYRAMRLGARGWEPLSRMYPWPDALLPRLSSDGYPESLGTEDGPPQLLMLSSDETSPFSLTFESHGRTWSRVAADGLGEVRVDD